MTGSSLGFAPPSLCSRRALFSVLTDNGRVLIHQMLSLQPQFGGPELPVALVLLLVCLAMADLRSRNWRVTIALGCLHLAITLIFLRSR